MEKKIIKRKRTKTGVNYVNNADFLDAMITYKEKVAAATKEGKEKPIVPNYIAECFLKIARHLIRLPNFVNYSYKEDMISDGIENCLRYCTNFDPEKSKNPFAYFTQICAFAFIRRIQSEKKTQYIKYKMSDMNSVLFGSTASYQDHDSAGNYDLDGGVSEYSQEYMSSFIEAFEESKKKKASAKKQVAKDEK